MTTLPERASADGEWWMTKMRLESLAFDCLCCTYNARYVPGNTTHAIQLSIHSAGLCSKANSFFFPYACALFLSCGTHCPLQLPGGKTRLHPDSSFPG